MKKLLLSAAGLIGFAAITNAQTGASATATATATIVAPITITKTVDVNFGNIATRGAGGQVVLPASATPTRTSSGDVTLPATSGTVTAAKFDITGIAAYTFAITLPSTAVVLTNTTGTGAETMNATAFTSSLGAIGTLDGSGLQTLYVGATLGVGGSQVPGVYVTATAFTVTVNYN